MVSLKLSSIEFFWGELIADSAYAYFSGDWMVEDIKAVDEATGIVYFVGKFDVLLELQA
jgi:hypothetical protein